MPNLAGTHGKVNGKERCLVSEKLVIGKGLETPLSEQVGCLGEFFQELCQELVTRSGHKRPPAVIADPAETHGGACARPSLTPAEIARRFDAFERAPDYRDAWTPAATSAKGAAA
jgi:hypothetical protein